LAVLRTEAKEQQREPQSGREWELLEVPPSVTTDGVTAIKQFVTIHRYISGQKGKHEHRRFANRRHKFALNQGDWNRCDPDTEPKDHTMRENARPNNDTLYIICLLDLRKDPAILEMPAFDSKYVSLMVTGYDHDVNIPMASR
jgi:hypothetical protein